MNIIKQSVSALVLGISSLALTAPAPAQADGGLSVIYSSHDYGYHAYPYRQRYYSYKPAWYGRSHVLPRHHHRYDYGYGHRKHDRWYKKDAWRHDNNDYGKGHRKNRDHDSYRGHDSRRRHTGHARVDRH